MCLDSKLDLITDSEKNQKNSQKDLSLRYGIGKATICDILKRKDEYRRQCEENIGSKRNKMSVPVNFLTWIMFSRCLVVFRSRRPGWWHFSQWTRPTFTIEWPVCFTWWYRGIWWQFDKGINFRWWMRIRLASEIYSRYHFVAIAWQWNRQWRWD